MPLNLTLVHSSLTNVNQSTEITINPTLTGKHLIIFTDSLGRNPKWVAAGTLFSEWDDVNIGRVRDKGWFIRFGHQRITIDDWQFLNPFVFKPKPWLINIKLQIWSTADFDLYSQLNRIEQDVIAVKDILEN